MWTSINMLQYILKLFFVWDNMDLEKKTHYILDIKGYEVAAYLSMQLWLTFWPAIIKGSHWMWWHLWLTLHSSLGPYFCWYGLTLIHVRISNYIHYKVWDQITYPFPNFKGAVEVIDWLIDWVQLPFWDSGHRGPCSPYKPCNHNLYIGIIIFPHKDNTQYMYVTITLRKRDIKKKHKKVKAPIKLTCHWRRQLFISLQWFSILN